MKFKYKSIEGLPKILNKYGIDFEEGKATEVQDLAIANKLKNSPYFTICTEVVKPKAKAKKVKVDEQNKD